MSRTRMFLILAILFMVDLLLIGFGDWLWIVTIVDRLQLSTIGDGWVIVHIWKPYGALALVLVVCGALVLAVTLGLLFDWYHLLIPRPEEDKLEVQK
jgi:hypothetical protein